MASKLFFTVSLFSLACCLELFANDHVTATTQPKERKKLKAHFVGSKRPPQHQPKEATPNEQPKKPRHFRNEWVVSKTHPKPAVEKKGSDPHKDEATVVQLTGFQQPEPPKFFAQDTCRIQAERVKELEKKLAALQAQIDRIDISDDREYPRIGVYAPRSTIYFTGEWLYWMTRAGGTEYAVARSSDTPGVFTDAVSKKVEFDWESGYRLGLGVHMPHDGWDIYACYTNFAPKKSHDADGSLFPLLAFQGQFPIANVTEADVHWSIDFQTLDLEIGRAFYFSPSLALRPFIGCKGAWIDQHARVKYEGGDIPAGEESKIRNRNDFKGGGLRAGVNSNWELGAGFSLFGNFSGALLVGHFDLDQTQIQEGVKTIDLDSDFNLLSPMAQMILGLSWDRNFARDRSHFGVSVGFESQYWWRQNQMEHFTDASLPIYVRPDEDLAFYGLTLQARFDF